MDDISKGEVESIVSIAYNDLESSKVLYDSGNYRNAIALAYYSMYSMSRALLLIKGKTPKTHSGLINVFGRLYVLDEGFDSDLASKFASCETTRENASYAFVDDFTKDDALETIELAEAFLIESEKFL